MEVSGSVLFAQFGSNCGLPESRAEYLAHLDGRHDTTAKPKGGLRRRSKRGSGRNPLSLDKAKGLPSTEAALRVDTVPGHPQIVPLACDRQLTFRCAVVRVVRVLLAMDTLASPNESPRHYQPIWPTIHDLGELATEGQVVKIRTEIVPGEPIPARQVVADFSAEYDAGDVSHDPLPSYLESEIEFPGTMPKNQTSAVVAVGRARLSLILTGEARIEHLGECIYRAMRDLSLVR